MSSLNPRANHTYELKVSLKSALLRGDTKELHDLLKQDYSLLNDSFDEEGNTLLMLAAKNPNITSVETITKYLLNLGADYSKIGVHKRTALDLATTSKNLTIQALLKAHHSELRNMALTIEKFIRRIEDFLNPEAALGVEEFKGEEPQTRLTPKGPITKAFGKALKTCSKAYAYKASSLEEALFLALLLDDLHQTLLTETSPDELKTEVLRLINDHSDRIGGTSYDYTNTMNLANRLCLALAQEAFNDRENPWSVLLERSLVQDREEAWMNVGNFEYTPPENPNLFYRVRDPRLTTQRDQTKIHVIEGILDQISQEAIASKKLSLIWQGTDVKGGNIQTSPLTSYDLTLLRQMSPGLSTLVHLTEQSDQQRQAQEGSRQTPNFYTAFCSLSSGLQAGKAGYGGTEYNAGSEANIALVAFRENFWDKLPQALQNKILELSVLNNDGHYTYMREDVFNFLFPGVAHLPDLPSRTSQGSVSYCISIIGGRLSRLLGAPGVKRSLANYEHEFRQDGKAIEDNWPLIKSLVAQAKTEIQTPVSLFDEKRIIAEEPLEFILKKPRSLVQAFLDAVTANQVQTVLALLRIFPEYNLMNCQGPLPNQQTALIKAVKAGHLKMVQILLDSGAEINAVDAFQSSALSWAVEKGLPMVDLLFGSRLPANSNQINNRGNTPLLAATYYSAESRIIQLLLLNGAKETIDHRNAQNQSALSWAIQHKRLDIQHLLVTAGADPTDLEPYGAQVILGQELSKRKPSEMTPSHLGLMKKLLVKKLEIRPDQLRQLFALAIKKNDTELFLLALDKRVFDKKVTQIQKPAGFNEWVYREFIAESTDSEAIAKTLDRLKKLGLGKYKILEIFQTPEENPELETLKHQAIRKILTAKAGTLPDGRPFDKHTSLAVNLFWKDRVFTRKSIEKGTLDALRAILPESRHFDPIVELPVEGPAPLATAAPTPNLAMVLLGAGAGTRSPSGVTTPHSRREKSGRTLSHRLRPGSTLEMASTNPLAPSAEII
jgi:ankyrin repeat protein